MVHWIILKIDSILIELNKSLQGVIPVRTDVGWDSSGIYRHYKLLKATRYEEGNH